MCFNDCGKPFDYEQGLLYGLKRESHQRNAGGKKPPGREKPVEGLCHR